MPDKGTYDVAVVGGGAAGLVAALAAAGSGHRTVLLDRNREPGRKILASGNGRCNLTNLDIGPQYFPHSDPSFVSRVLEGHDAGWLREFFRDLGLETVVEEQRVWPASFEARSVRDLLVGACTRAGVRLLAGAHVDTIVRTKDLFRLQVRGLENGKVSSLGSRRVVLTAGGKSYGTLGASDSGYALARALGHTVTPLDPGLVPLRTEVSKHHKLQGLKVCAEMTLRADGKQAPRELCRVEGDLLFADYGVSGQGVLNLSSLAAGELARADRGDLTLCVNFLPGRAAGDLARWLSERRERRPDAPLAQDLEGFLPRKLARFGLLASGLAGSGGPETLERPLKTVDDESFLKLARWLTGFEIPVKGVRGFGQAMVTVGGVNTGEVDPATMASLRVPSLSVAGELLDVQGLSGGFNLHFAFASGHRAGEGTGVRY